MYTKVDVAIQSYKKPESLIYSLLTLHQHSQDSVDTVWINDDQSPSETLAAYTSTELLKAVHPWKIKVRRNKHRMGWWLSFVKGYKPAYLTVRYMLLRMIWNFYKNKSLFVDKEDLRYQWAIENTDKEYLFIMHDDISFNSDIIKLYLSDINRLKNPGIVGDLGQCWRCIYSESNCRPEKICAGQRPHPQWPKTRLTDKDHKWACRINEWSALLKVSAAKLISEKHKVFFGNYDDRADLSAYWFSKLVEEKMDFNDPLAGQDKSQFYLHWEDGKTGHSVWIDQGFGKSTYDPLKIRASLKKQFNFDYKWGHHS